ncbi:MAG: prepilin peptidase [Parvularculaceae bacterium]
MGFLFLLLFACALAIGSFLNVLILRGPHAWGLVAQGKTPDFLAPRSRCPACQNKLGVKDLIPVLSYVLLKGKCRHCRAAISRQYPLIEALTGIAGLVALWAFGLTWAALAAFTFLAFLIALGEIDRQTGFLPDWLTLPLLGLGLGVNATALFIPFGAALIGAAVGFFSFWAIGLFYRKFRHIDALGLGDAKLLAAIGAWVGWATLPIVVLIAAGAGLAAVAIAALRGAKITGQTAIHFGPFLALSGAIGLLVF